MKTGLEMIADERQQQIEKYGYTGEHHAQHPEFYVQGQIATAVNGLTLQGETREEMLDMYERLTPEGWDIDRYKKMLNKPELERFAIAGAMIAAEIDRLQALQTPTP